VHVCYVCMCFPQVVIVNRKSLARRYVYWRPWRESMFHFQIVKLSDQNYVRTLENCIQVWYDMAWYMVWYACACPESLYSIMLPALCFQNYFWIFYSSISCLSYKFPLMIYIQRFWYIHSCLVRHACFTGERWRRIRSSLGTIASKTNVQTSKYPHLKISSNVSITQKLFQAVDCNLTNYLKME
jgi:hypothetical protein